MMLLKKEHAKSSGASCSYSPIARALSKLPDLEKSELRVKFELAYLWLLPVIPRAGMKWYILKQIFCVLRPSSGTASGLLECVNHALCKLGITEVSATQCKKLVRFGTDGAAANSSKNGLLKKSITGYFGCGADLSFLLEIV